MNRVCYSKMGYGLGAEVFEPKHLSSYQTGKKFLAEGRNNV